MNAKTRVEAEELVRRASELAPVLAERAPAADAARSLPAETIRDLQEAGLFRVLQPAAWGGFEHDPQVFFDAQIELAKGCPSTAWVFGVVAVHSWQLALFDAQAQEDVWGEDSSVLISSSYMPVGKVERVEGGYQLSGRWGYSSGSDHCDWVFLGAFVPPVGGKGPPDMRTFLVPRVDYRIEDTWHTSGLKGTGSNDIVVEGCFVPEHRTHRFSDGFKCKSPGNAVNDAPLYRLPFGQIFVRSVSTTAIGILEAAIDEYQTHGRERVGRGDGASAAGNPVNQQALAHARVTLDELKLVLQRNMAELMAAAEGGETVSLERRIQFRYESGMVVSKCVDAIDGLFVASGGSAIFCASRINGLFQDIHAARAHYANFPDKPGWNMGGTMLGLKNTDYFI